MKKLTAFAFCFLLLLSACGSKPALKPGSPLELASFTENAVSVSIALELDKSGQTWLAATFTPEKGEAYLYSKDTPVDGVNGLGRPTLIELVAGTQIQPAGEPAESETAEESSEAEGLFEYPAGPVTLRLPVTLPAGDGWFDENVSVTYMACGGGVCYPPVERKIVLIRVPGAEAVNKP
jgi:hypothetical protein